VTRVDYLLLSQGEFSIQSDHLNLTYIYNPLCAYPTLASHVVHKLQLWELKMSVFSYRMGHVMRELIYWTDLMTRWGVGWIEGSKNKAHVKMASLFAKPYISPPDYDTVVIPSKKQILLLQHSAVNEYERYQQGNATAWQEVSPQQVDAGDMKMMKNALWIPERSVEQPRLFVEGHCRSIGHRVYEATLGAIKEKWCGQRWRRMSRSLCKSIAQCRNDSWRLGASTAGYTVSRNQAQRDPALRLRLHWVVKRQEVSVLLLKDDLSGYLWLVPCRTDDSADTVDALMRWFAVFGVVLLWISDRGSHFKNEIVRREQKVLKAKHHFTTANCPWSNGTIESACKKVIRAFRAVLSELKIWVIG
jgi:hypothetical protein